MSVYTFDNTKSPIDKLTVYHTAGGGMRAYLHANENSDPADLAKIKTALTRRNLQWTPILEAGSPALEVRGFGKHESKLLHLLSADSATLGEAHKAATKDDKTTFKDKFRKNTLRASGAAYFLGDMSYLKYTWHDSHNQAGKLVKPSALAGGIFYALGTPFIMIFGRGDKSDLQFRHMSYNMLHELEEKKVAIPKDASVRAVANGHNTTAWKKFKTFCARYPAEITNSIFAAAGSMILIEKGGELKTFKWKPFKLLKEGGFDALKKSFKTENVPKNGQTAHTLRSVLGDIGLGSMTVLAGLISVFVEEEKPKPGEPKKTGLAGLWQKVKERPLAAASAALMASTIAHATSTADDLRGARKALRPENIGNFNTEQIWEKRNLVKSLPYRGIFVGSNIAAEVLMAVSSKGHGAGVISDKSLDTSAYAIAADLVYHSQPEKREVVLKSVSEFLAGKKHLAQDQKVVLSGIQKQLEAMENNPWAGDVAKKKSEADASMSSSNWQGKVATPAKPLAPVVPMTSFAGKHQEAVEAGKDSAAFFNRA